MGVDSMTMQQCKYVIAVYKCGSFSRAAKMMYVAQSSLSMSVKALEDELGIIIFERASGGVYLTDDGAEFLRYATQLAEQHDFIVNRYCDGERFNKLYVSTQHYDFVADIFAKMIRETKDEKYQFALRETKTYDVINEIETAYSDIGILSIKGSDDGIMSRYLNNKGITFTPLLKVFPHVFIRKNHPLSVYKVLKYENLKQYPFVSYEQGEHNNSFFAEEISIEYSDKRIEISDRASLMNILLSSDCYTVGTGIMPSALNSGNIISIPFANEEYYTIGYILRSDRQVPDLTAKFIELLKELLTG